eukprot:483065_1
MAKRTWHELDSEIDYHSNSPSPKKPCKSWNCIYCDVDNHESLNICKSCQSWKCKLCKIVNPEYENKCTQCNKSNRLIPISNKWDCIGCTYINNNNTNKCEICETPKPKIIIPKLPNLELQSDKNMEIKNQYKMNDKKKLDMLEELRKVSSRRKEEGDKIKEKLLNIAKSKQIEEEKRKKEEEIQKQQIAQQMAKEKMKQLQNQNYSNNRQPQNKQQKQSKEIKLDNTNVDHKNHSVNGNHQN